MEDFALSKWIDCRINAYNYLGEEDPGEQAGRGFTPQNPDQTRDATMWAHSDPSFIMIDIDRKSFSSEKTFHQALRATMRRIRETFLLDKHARPYTIMDTVGGAHFLIPLECDPAEFDAPTIHRKDTLLSGLNYNEFIRFCARYLSNGHVDKGFYPSINSTMVRIPGGINSKYKGNKAIVQYITKWDGKTKGHMLCLLGEFYRYMQQEQQQRNKQRQSRLKLTHAKVNHIDNGSDTVALQEQQYWYVKELLGFGIGDFRKRAISLLLSPWCITVKKIDHDAAERTLLDWIDKCEVIKPLDFDAYKVVNQALVYAESRQYRPLGLFKVKDQSPELYNKLMQLEVSVPT
jgi:hypothetical protein